MKRRHFLPMALCLILAIIMCLALAACGNETTLTHLSTPVVTVSADGKAGWAAVDNASSYSYKIDNGEEKSTTQTEVTLSDGQSITVKAVGDGIKYTDSDWSTAVTYTAPTTPSNPTKLDTPTVTVNTDGLASWTAVANATKYAYQIGDANPVETENTTAMLTDGQSIKVKAVGNGTTYTDSDWSTAVTYTAPTTPANPTKLDTPTVTVDTDGTATWAAVANASGYKYKIDNGTETDTTNTSVTLTDGQSIEVKAVGNGTTYTDSDWSTAVTYTAQSTPSTPTEVEIDFKNEYEAKTGDATSLPLIDDNCSLEVDGVTLLFTNTKGNSDPTFYKNGFAVRLYSSSSTQNTLTITANQTIKKIIFNTDTNNRLRGTFAISEQVEQNEVLTPTGVFDVTTQTWYGEVAANKKLVITPSAQARITKITVYLGALSNTEKVDLALMELPDDISGTHNTNFTVPTTTANAKLAVNWSVREKSGDGNIEIAADGTVTVTRGETSDTTAKLTASVTSGLVTKTKDFDVTVTKKPAEGEHDAQWTLVTDLSQINDGKEHKIMIVGIITKTNTFMTFGEKATNNFKAAELDLSDPKTEKLSGATILTIEKGTENEKFAIGYTDASNKKSYLCAKGNGSNNLLQIQNDKANWSISIDNTDINKKGIATVICENLGSNNVLRYNNSSKIFSCYSPEKASNQQDIYIYVWG